MSNGRSFSRRRRTSPKKSQRLAKKQRDASWAFQRQVQEASAMGAEIAKNAAEQAAELFKTIKPKIEELAVVSGRSEEWAKETMLDVLDAPEEVKDELRRME